MAEKYKMEKVVLKDEARDMLMRDKWPGNIRQLKNVTEQISILSPQREITAEVLTQFIPHDPDSMELAPIEPAGKHSYESERELLYKVLYELRGNVAELRHELDTLRKQIDENSMAAGAQGFQHTLPRVPVSTIQAMPAEEAIAEEIKTDPAEPMNIEKLNKQMVSMALEKANGNRKKAAIALGISDRTLYRRIKQYGLD